MMIDLSIVSLDRFGNNGLFLVYGPLVMLVSTLIFFPVVIYHSLSEVDFFRLLAISVCSRTHTPFLIAIPPPSVCVPF